MTDEQIKGIARAINPHWWNDDIDLLDFTRAVLARAGQKHPSSGESHEDSLKSRDEALRLADALEAIHENNADSLLALNVIRQAGPELRRLHAENDKLKTALRRVVRTYMVADDAWDHDAELERLYQWEMKT